MGKIQGPEKVKLIVGIITCCAGTAEEAGGLLEKKFGRIDARSAVIPFDFTNYYEKEMGGELRRQWWSFEKHVDPESLPAVKTATNKIEEKLGVNNRRRINIDPGYIAGSRLVLASTKDFSHRVYLSKGIYAEITLIYEKGAFKHLPWTYPDYKTEKATEFFFEARSLYLKNSKKDIRRQS